MPQVRCPHYGEITGRKLRRKGHVVFGFGKGQKDLQQELDSATERIQQHPLPSDQMREADGLVAPRKAQGDSREQIDEALAAGELPSLEEHGRIQVKNTLSWANLHCNRRKLEKKIAEVWVQLFSTQRRSMRTTRTFDGWRGALVLSCEPL